MQKKSLLVALFFGALCLTGCLKNEESASVAQVRIAVAEEHKAAAALKNAKAQAELIYANAEAKLKEAQAALINAQAETEKVRAELLKVQVKLQEVKVDEERVVLQKMQAELEVLLAKAEAQKQFWVNELNNLLAQAQKDAIENTQKLIEAQADVEAYILKLEGAKADSAAVYSQKYFAALQKVAEAQLDEVAIKAASLLLGQGAYVARKLIYDQIDENNEQIAENNAKIAYLKAHQTMTPEEAEAALKEAWAELNEAYNALDQANDALTEALGEQTDLETKISDFNNTDSKWYYAFKRDIKNVFGPLYGHDYVDVEVGGTTESVWTSGVIIPDEEAEAGYVFYPFFSNEAYGEQEVVRYPDPEISVYHPGDFVELTTTPIIPATIYYDNIQNGLIAATAAKAVEVAAEIADFEEDINEEIEADKEKVAEYKEKQELHKKYVAARKDTVEKYEAAFLAALATEEASDAAVENAWKAFQEYMVLKTDVSRDVFINRYELENAYKEAKADSAKKAEAFVTMLEGAVFVSAYVQEEFEAMAKAEGDYKKAIDKRTTGSAKDKYNDFLEAEAKWNPDFDECDVDPQPYFAGDTTWSKYVEPVYIYAGSSQNKTLNAKLALKTAEEDLAAAKIDYLRGIITETQYNAVKATRDSKKVQLEGNGTTIDGRQKEENMAKTDYGTKKTAYETAMGDALMEALEDWNPAFNVFNYVRFPDAKHPDEEYDYWNYDEEEGWIYWGQEPGAAQLALMDAVKDATDYFNEGSEIAMEFWFAKSAAEDAYDNLETANADLIVALGGDPETDDIKELVGDADKLYQAYLDAEDEWSGRWDAWNDLWNVYHSYNTDRMGTWEDGTPWYHVVWGWEGASPEREFGWMLSNYNVDYSATMLNSDGEEESIARNLYGWIAAENVDFIPEGVEPDENGDIPYIMLSFQYKMEKAQNDIDVVHPGELADFKADKEQELKDYAQYAQDIMDAVNAFKASETGYLAWVAEREAAEQVVNEAKKVQFDAAEEYAEVKAEYDALKIVADGGMWIYNDEIGDFVWINLNDTIDELEDANKKLEFENKVHKNVLTDGKKVYEYAQEMLEQALQVVQDKIQILLAIADKYRMIMDAYLGIVEETVVEPVEGDEE